MRMESIKEFCLEICCEMLINACSASLSDIRMLLDITSCSAENSIGVFKCTKSFIMLNFKWGSKFCMLFQLTTAFAVLSNFVTV